MKILMIGPQGSGKSTQAGLLAEFFGTPKITVGNIFRQIAASSTQEGERIKQILASGQLVDDQTTAELVKKRVSRNDAKRGFIMDGYPRTIEQLNIFDPGFDKVLYLDVPEEVVIERLIKRGRSDDTPESIKMRLGFYYKQTAPLLEFYRNLEVLSEVDGLGTIEQVQQRIREGLNDRDQK